MQAFKQAGAGRGERWKDGGAVKDKEGKKGSARVVLMFASRCG